MYLIYFQYTVKKIENGLIKNTFYLYFFKILIANENIV